MSGHKISFSDSNHSNNQQKIANYCTTSLIGWPIFTLCLSILFVSSSCQTIKNETDTTATATAKKKQRQHWRFYFHYLCVAAVLFFLIVRKYDNNNNAWYIISHNDDDGRCKKKVAPQCESSEPRATRKWRRLASNKLSWITIIIFAWHTVPFKFNQIQLSYNFI